VKIGINRNAKMKLYCLCTLLWLCIGMIEADAGTLAQEKYEDYQEKFNKQIAALHEKVDSVKRRQADPKSQADVEAAVKQIVLSEMDKYRTAHKTSYCQMGHSVKIKGTEWGGKAITKTTITFGQAFPSVPKVIVAIHGLNKIAGKMNINWGAECCESVKTTSFVLPQNVPYNVLWVRYSWIACA